MVQEGPSSILKQNSVSGNNHLLGLQRSLYRPNCVVVQNFNHLKRDKPEVVQFTMLGLVIPSGIPPQNQVTFLKNLLVGFLIKC